MGTTYSISFDAAPRNNYQSETIQVLSMALCTPPSRRAWPALSPVRRPPTSTRPTRTHNFSFSTATQHTITFQGTPTSGRTDCTAFDDDVMITTGAGISDGSFEDVALAANAYAPIQSSAAGFFRFQPASAPMTAFSRPESQSPSELSKLPTSRILAMSQQVDLNAGMEYNISFLADQRLDYQTQYHSIYVYIDSLSNPPVGISTPATTRYRPLKTMNFTFQHRGCTPFFVVSTPIRWRR